MLDKLRKLFEKDKKEEIDKKHFVPENGINEEVKRNIAELEMHGFPVEHELLSLFECEPTLLDSTSNDFFYNVSTYRFCNGEEDFIVTLSPSDSEVKIQVTHKITNELISIIDLKRVDNFEIITDKKGASSVLLRILNDDFLQTIEIDFKPKFKFILKEHFLT